MTRPLVGRRALRLVEHELDLARRNAAATAARSGPRPPFGFREMHRRFVTRARLLREIVLALKGRRAS